MARVGSLPLAASDATTSPTLLGNPTKKEAKRPWKLKWRLEGGKAAAVKATSVILEGTKPVSITTDVVTDADITTVAEIQAVATLSPLWQQAMKNYISRLPEQDRARLLQFNDEKALDIISLQGIFMPLQTQYGEQRISRILTRMGTLVQHIRSFAIVVDVCVQSNPSLASLVWGGVRLMLEISARSAELTERIQDMLDTLCEHLTLFEKWGRLFPASDYKDVGHCLVSVYTEYISFLVETIIYLNRNPLKNWLLVLTKPTFEKSFKDTERKIAKLTENLYKQVHTANFEAQGRREQRILAILEAKNNAQTLNFDHKLPYKFLHGNVKNDRFYGRSAELKTITQYLADSYVTLKTISIHGLGGSGKSQIALEYVYQNFTNYEIILWFNADTFGKLETQFGQVARYLGFSDEDGKLDQDRAALKHWLAHIDKKWLIVFDNADDITIVREFWPASPRGAIIMTSQNPLSVDEGLARKGIPLKALSRDEGAEFLFSYLEEDAHLIPGNKDAALTISELFDGLPLGLKVAAAYSKEQHLSLTEFLEEYEKYSARVETQPVSHNTNKNLHNIWEMALSKVTPEGKSLLDILVFLDPDEIPIDLLEKLSVTSILGSPPWDRTTIRNARGSLINQSFITIYHAVRTINMHRYFQKANFKKLQQCPERYLRGLLGAIELILQIVPPIEFVPMRHKQHWIVRETYQTHVESLRLRSTGNVPVSALNPLVELLFRYTYYYYEVGYYNLGFATFEHAQSLVTTARCDLDSRVVSNLYFAHARMCNESNRPHLSINSLEKALSRFEETTHESADVKEKAHLSAIYSCLGNALVGSGRFDEAKECHLKAIDITTALEGEHAARLGHLWANLGSCLLWMGDLDQAEKVLHKALLKHTRNLECNMYALGNVFLAKREYSKAFGLHQEVLELFGTNLGPNHHATADSFHKVGSILALEAFEGRDLENSERHIRKAIAIYDHAMEKNHTLEMEPSIMRSKWKLAQILYTFSTDISKLAEARDLEHQANSYLENHLKQKFEVTDREAMEKTYDSLVYYWSR